MGTVSIICHFLLLLPQLAKWFLVLPKTGCREGENERRHRKYSVRLLHLLSLGTIWRWLSCLRTFVDSLEAPFARPFDHSYSNHFSRTWSSHEPLHTVFQVALLGRIWSGSGQFLIIFEPINEKHSPILCLPLGRRAFLQNSIHFPFLLPPQDFSTAACLEIPQVDNCLLCYKLLKVPL